MFPCGHVFYSTLVIDDGSIGQAVGAILPDAAAYGAFSWDDLHEIDTVAQIALPSHVAAGIRHHIELDDRSHRIWRDGRGYAYAKQTAELRAAVKRACDVDTHTAHTLAHDFIECAVDMRVIEAHPRILLVVHDALRDFDIGPTASAIAEWNNTSADVVATAVDSFLKFWLRHDETTLDGMVDLWSELCPLLKRDTFHMTEDDSFDRSKGRDALEMALELVSEDFDDVVRPGNLVA